MTNAHEDSLIHWKGHVVPWVARWSGEVIPKSIKTTLMMDKENGSVAVRASYDDGVENRENSGVLWMREGLTRVGEPQFSQVNAYRQRLCMARRKCQVCGKVVPAGVIPWLLGKAQVETTRDGGTLTMSPPTCEDCVPIALRLCPHLKSNDWVMAKVLEYQVWGVSGQVLVVDQGKVRALHHKLVGYKDEHPFPLFSVVAKQQVVEFTKFTIETP